MAFLSGLKNDKSKIEICLNDSFTLEMSYLTHSLVSNYGYIEPTDADRQDILTDQSLEEEYFTEVEE